MSESPGTQEALFAEGSQEEEGMVKTIMEEDVITSLDGSGPPLLNASNPSGKEGKREGDGKRG